MNIVSHFWGFFLGSLCVNVLIDLEYVLRFRFTINIVMPVLYLLSTININIDNIALCFIL